MKSLYIILLTLFCANTEFAEQASYPMAKMTVRVIDESGQPVENAEVSIQFVRKTNDLPAFAVGPTDLRGEFTAEGHSEICLSAGIQKDGYYLSATPGIIFNGLTNGIWYPWNPVAQVLLRKIGKPIPMYAKAIRADIPAKGKACGYDLELGDWVAPYGKGRTSDFVVTWTNSPMPNYDFNVTGTLTFSNPMDGVQETHLNQYTNTLFRWPREAPESGYEPSFTSRCAWPTGGHGKLINTFDPKVDQTYFFRVRTVTQDGRIVSALYGKIDGGIAVDPMNGGQSCKLFLTYYLNPTPMDRNMEFDPHRNLFRNLPMDESVRRP